MSRRQKPSRETQHAPALYLRSAYTDIAYAFSQFTDDELKAAGMTPKLRAAASNYLAQYVVASIDDSELRRSA